MFSWLQNHKIEIRIFFTIWLVYAVFATPAGGVTPNRYMDLVHSIVNEGRFAIDTYHENTVDKAYYNGHYYAGALPGPSFLAVPFYAAFKGLYQLIPDVILDMAGSMESFKAGSEQQEVGFYAQVDNVEFFLSQFFLNITVLAAASAFGSTVLFRVIRHLGFTVVVALRTTFFYAFGTIVFFYSTTFFEQVFSATVAICAFYYALRVHQQTDRHHILLASFLSGLFAGSGLLVEYTTVFFAGWIGLWFLIARRWHPFISFSLGFVVPVVILMFYQYSIFSNPLESPYMHLIEEHQSVHGIGFFGATFPHLERFIQLTVGLERGLFLFMPITLAGIIGLVIGFFKKENVQPILVCGLIIVTYLLFYSSFTNWRGGSAFGPRYLIPTLPFILIGLSFAYKIFSARLVDMLGIISVFINWLGAQYNFAETIFDHFITLFRRGPALPVLGAVLSHSTNPDSALYRMVYGTYIPLTLGITVLFIVGIFWFWKDMLFGTGSTSGNPTVLQNNS